jgi:hypothetical protein
MKAIDAIKLGAALFVLVLRPWSVRLLLLVKTNFRFTMAIYGTKSGPANIFSLKVD